MKAVEAAIQSRQWNKAIQILQVIQDPQVSGRYYKRIAVHYASIAEYEVRSILVYNLQLLLDMS